MASCRCVCECVSSSYWSLFKLCGQCCDCVFCPSVQINRHYHAVKGGAFSTEHLDQGTTFLIQLIKTMRRTKPNWTKEQQLKGKNAFLLLATCGHIPKLFKLLEHYGN